ncbi:hypothetical protein CDD83_1526 [Cordyceps sp. RAO-2017]|nr:hypothetical protein CDD83_1526 [Cordyceps sp. RAO-2017]
MRVPVGDEGGEKLLTTTVFIAQPLKELEGSGEAESEESPDFDTKIKLPAPFEWLELEANFLSEVESSEKMRELVSGETLRVNCRDAAYGGPLDAPSTATLRRCLGRFVRYYTTLRGLLS